MNLDMCKTAGGPGYLPAGPIMERMVFMPPLSLLIPIGIVVILILALFFTGYVKASPDTAYIISGLRRQPKVLIGKAGVKIPFLEKKDILNLQLIPIDVKTSNAVPTADYININVDAAVNVKISDQPELLRVAAQNFLNQPTAYICAVAREVLEGNMREIVGKMDLQEMVSDRQKFAELVKQNAEPDLASMGLDIVSFNVQNFIDDSGVIENLGVDNIVKIQKTAAIARAESEKEIAKAKAMAQKEANDAQVAAQQEIAIKQNDLAVKQAELKRISDAKKAEADAAYRIQEQEQRRTIEIATSDADIAKQEKEIVIKKREAEVQEEALNASVKKQADAELYRRQKEAEAQKFEMQRAAEAALFAKEQEATGIRRVGEAEAEAIRQKGLAEAEAMEKKAEAYQKYNSAAMGEMLIRVLPDIAQKIAEPMAAIDKVTIIGSGSEGVSSVADGVPAVMAKLFETMRETVGIDLNEIVRAGSYDAKVNRNVAVSGIPETITLNTQTAEKEEETAVEEKDEDESEKDR